MMTIRLNGETREVSDGMTVEKLLEEVGMKGKAVVVEMNEMVVFPKEYSTKAVEHGAKLEIVALAAGG